MERRINKWAHEKEKKKKRKVRIQYYDFILQHHSSLYSLFLLIFPLDKISLHYLFRNDWRLLSLMREYVFSCFPCWGLWILWKESVFTRSIKKFNSTFQNYCSFCNQLLLWKCAEWIINHSIHISSKQYSIKLRIIIEERKSILISIYTRNNWYY